MKLIPYDYSSEEKRYFFIFCPNYFLARDDFCRLLITFAKQFGLRSNVFRRS